MKKYISFVALALMAMFICSLVACGGKEDEVEDQNNPAVPVNPGDYQTVPVTGGTIEKGDIAITFPSGTFDADTKVAITEVKKGSVGGEYEASPFYQITLPESTKKPITLEMKAEDLSGEAEFVVRSPGYAISLVSDVSNEATAETTYSNGVYATTFPAFDNSDNKDNVSVTVGLCKAPDESAARKTTRASIQNKYKNIKWNLDIDYWFENSSEYKVLSRKLPVVDGYIQEAIKTLYDLGFRMPDSVTINYHLADTDSWIWGDSYGYYSRSLICRSRDGIWLKDQVAMGTGAGDIKLMKQTIIHETLHNFQSYYHLHYYRIPTGDHLSMYEIGAIWIEKFMNGGKTVGKYQLKDGGMRSTYTNNFRAGLSQSSSDVKEMYGGYAEQGYALGPLLHYMISKNYSRGFDDTTIISFYDFWARITTSGYTLIDVLNEWYNTTYKEKFFDGTDHINNYYLSLWKGELMPDFNISLLPPYVKDITKKKIDLLDEEKSKLSLEGKVYPYGCEGLLFKMDNTCFVDSTLNNDEMVIKQEAKGVKTYLLYSKGTSVLLYPQVATSKDSIVVSGAELEALREDGVFNSTFFLLTVREKCSLTDTGTIPTQTSVDIRPAEDKRQPVCEVTFSMNVALQYWDEKKGEYVRDNFASYISVADKKDGTIRSTEKGNDLHVECKGKSILGEEGTLSFDIINWKNWSTNTTKVMNVKYHMAKTMLGDVSAEMTNIPITETDVEYLSSEATVSNGVKFSTFDFTEQRDPAREPLLSSPDNSVYMTIYFRQEYWHWDIF